MGLGFFLYDGGGTKEELRVKKRDIVILCVIRNEKKIFRILSFEKIKKRDCC